MPRRKPVDPHKATRESLIEEAIIANPDRLGFPGALAIRRCRVAEPCGAVDLMLLPLSGATRLVLVEAKSSKARDAGAKVVGQLLMYYAGSLMLGTEGLRMLQEYARDFPERARSSTKISPKALTRGLSPQGKAWPALYAGTPLRPADLQLFVAFDGEPHRAFTPVLSTLSQNHGLRLGYCVVQSGRIKRVELSAAG